MKTFETKKTFVALGIIILCLQNCSVASTSINKKNGYLNITNSPKKEINRSSTTNNNDTAAGPVKN